MLGLMSNVQEYYERFWKLHEGSCGERTHRRSLQRAVLADRLLGLPGTDTAGTPHRLLDVGCGPGYGAAYFAARGFRVTGIEVAPTAAAAARAEGLEVVCCDIEQEDLPPGPFDAICALEVLEHLHHPREALQRLLAALAPEGRLVISLPNEFHLVNRLAMLVGREPFGGHDDPHRHHFGWRSVRRFIGAAGFDLCAVRAATIVPPGWGIAGRLGSLLARLSPALWGISFVMRIEPSGVPDRRIVSDSFEPCCRLRRPHGSG